MGRIVRRCLPDRHTSPRPARCLSSAPPRWGQLATGFSFPAYTRFCYFRNFLPPKQTDRQRGFNDSHAEAPQNEHQSSAHRSSFTQDPPMVRLFFSLLLATALPTLAARQRPETPEAIARQILAPLPDPVKVATLNGDRRQTSDSTRSCTGWR